MADKPFSNSLIWALGESFWVALILGIFLAIFVHPEGCSVGNILFNTQGDCPSIYSSYIIGFTLAYIGTVIVLTIYKFYKGHKK